MAKEKSKVPLSDATIAKLRYVYERTKGVLIYMLIGVIIAPAVVLTTMFYGSATDSHLWLDGWFTLALPAAIVISYFIILFFGAARYKKVFPRAARTMCVFPLLTFLFAGIGAGMLVAQGYLYYDEMPYLQWKLLFFGTYVIPWVLAGGFFIAVLIIYIVAHFKLPISKEWKQNKKDLSYLGDKQLKQDILSASKEGDKDKLDQLIDTLHLHTEQKRVEEERIKAEQAERERNAREQAEQYQRQRAEKLGIALEYDGESCFDGTYGGYIGWSILCFLVNLVTLYIARPVTLCWMERWKANHTVIKGRRVTFSGTAAGLMGSWILWWFLSLITVGIFALFVPVRMEKWVAKHTHFVGEEDIEGSFDGKTAQYLGYKLLGRIIKLFTLLIGTPLAMALNIRWEVKHTIIAGTKLKFAGYAAGLMGRWMLWWFLSIITLGIFGLFVPVKVQKWRVSHIELEKIEHFDTSVLPEQAEENAQPEQ